MGPLFIHFSPRFNGLDDAKSLLQVCSNHINSEMCMHHCFLAPSGYLCQCAVHPLSGTVPSIHFEHNISLIFTGIDHIKQLARESIQTKPFSLAVGKEWTRRKSTFPLEDTYTEVHFQMKDRKSNEIEKKPLNSIFDVLRYDKMRRLLIEGTI